LLFYNLACCESLTGRTTDALDHPRRAIDMSEEFRGHAKRDSDLDRIRDQPAFRQLISDWAGWTGREDKAGLLLTWLSRQ
jgi:hypothetical protein